ncbi:hypothetical protein K3495_g11421 [Podosphaera aphanis]|nr:hypothetical protein K3495_g11421 [Podosphaera aphanis]
MNAYVQEQGMSPSEDESQDQDLIDEIEALTLNIDRDLFKTSNTDPFHAHSSTITPDNAKIHLQNLANNSLSHLLTCEIPLPENFLVNGRYSSNIFHGVMLDTGAASISTAGHKQAIAYISEFGGRIDTSSAGYLTAHFGVGKSTSFGTFAVKPPIGSLTFHVVNAETPFLLCLQDMDKFKIYFNNLIDALITNDGS